MKSLYKNISLIKFEIIYIAYWLRFSGFDDNWSLCKFDDLFNFQVAGDMKKELFNEEYSDEFKYPLFANALEKDGLLGYYKEYKYEPDSITVTARGNVGYATVRNERFNAVGRLIILTSKNDLNMNFFSEYINNNVKVHIESTGVPQLTAPSLKINKLHYPSLNEQNKISNFLVALNKKIGLLEKKHDQYQNFKKYLMQQIFAQKLRFDFKNEWRQCKLKDLLTVKSSNISINQLEDNTGEYPLYGASGFLTNIDFCEMETDYISIVKDGSGVGNLSFHEKNSSIVNTSQYLLPKKDFDIHFLYYQLQTLNLLKYVNGSSIPHIYFKDYCIEKVTVPSLPEQQKIGKLFVDTDKTLENIDNNIRVTQEFKKGLLQQMFV